jgi:hypothetical protein
MDRRHFIAVMTAAYALPGSLRAQTLPQVLATGDTSAMLVLRGGNPIFAHGDLAQISYLASVPAAPGEPAKPPAQPALPMKP